MKQKGREVILNIVRKVAYSDSYAQEVTDWILRHNSVKCVTVVLDLITAPDTEDVYIDSTYDHLMVEWSICGGEMSGTLEVDWDGEVTEKSYYWVDDDADAPQDEYWYLDDQYYEEWGKHSHKYRHYHSVV